LAFLLDNRTRGGAFLGSPVLLLGAAGIAKLLFFLFLVMGLIFFILGMSAGRRIS